MYSDMSEAERGKAMKLLNRGCSGLGWGQSFEERRLRGGTKSLLGPPLRVREQRRNPPYFIHPRRFVRTGGGQGARGEKRPKSPKKSRRDRDRREQNPPNRGCRGLGWGPSFEERRLRGGTKSLLGHPSSSPRATPQPARYHKPDHKPDNRSL